MGKLRDFINDNYATDPQRAVRFVNRTVRLVKVGRHWWRGYRKIAEGTVEVAGQAVRAEAVTKPSWKLLPQEVSSEFLNFEKAIDSVISQMCVSKSTKEEDDSPLVFGNGVYAVDIALWPKTNELLKKLQISWDEAANKYCTIDGYQNFHDLIKAQVGETEYETVKSLVPPAEVLRGRFWLEVTPLAFRLTEDVGDPDEDRGRATAVTEMIEAAVKGPRDEAATCWRALASQLVTINGPSVTAHRPLRKARDGTFSNTSRHVRADSVINAARAITDLDRAARFHDPLTLQAIDTLKKNITEDKSTATVLASSINSNDNEAVRVARLLLDAADVVSDEANMCIGVGLAMAANTI